MSTYETRKARSEAANRAFYAFMDAYADAIGEKPAINDPETKAARRLAAEAFGFFTAYPATDDDRATVAHMVEAIADRAREAAALAHYQTADAAARAEEAAARAEAAAAPIYQRHELLAYLGEPEDYDIDAIEAEATTFTADGARVWTAFGSDLAAIAERHELVAYWPAV